MACFFVFAQLNKLLPSGPGGKIMRRILRKIFSSGISHLGIQQYLLLPVISDLIEGHKHQL